jgi:hypothetical protein
MTKAISLTLLKDRIRVWILIPIGAIAVIPATLIEPSSTLSVSNFFTWFAIKGIAIFFLITIINFTILKFSLQTRTRNTVLVGIVGFFSGLFLSSATQFAADLIGIAEPTNFTSKGLVAGIFTSLWVVLIFTSNDSFSKLSQRREELLADFYEIDRTTTSENAFLNTLKYGYSRSIQEETSSISEGIERDLTSTKALELNSKQFLGLIDKQLADLEVLVSRIRMLENRFLSIKLSGASSMKRRSSAFVRYIKISVGKEIVTPLFLSTTVPASLMWPALRNDSLEIVLPPLALLAIFIFLTQSAIRLFSRFVSNSLLNVFSVLITSSAAILSLGLLPNKIIADQSRGHLIRYVILVVIVSVLTTLFHLNKGLLFDAAETLDESDRIYAESRDSASQIRSEISKITANWLQHVHGNIKPRLYAASLTIQKSNASEDPNEYILALNTAREFLVGFEYANNATSRTREEELAFRVERWDGIVEIDVIDHAMDYQNCRLSAIELADLIEEGISNAVRHGKCTKISITLEPIESKGIKIEIRDNGTGIAATQPGLGSSFFDTLTAGNWHRERDQSSQSTVLTLRINP